MDIRTLDKRMQKFKFEAFSFIGDNQFVYLHCKVLVCNATDPNSRCAQGCVQRKKRALATQISKDEEVHVSQGPFMRGDDEEETKLEETVKDMRDTEKSGEFIHRKFNVPCSFHDGHLDISHGNSTACTGLRMASAIRQFVSLLRRRSLCRHVWSRHVCREESCVIATDEAVQQYRKLPLISPVLKQLCKGF